MFALVEAREAAEKKMVVVAILAAAKVGQIAAISNARCDGRERERRVIEH